MDAWRQPLDPESAFRVGEDGRSGLFDHDPHGLERRPRPRIQDLADERGQTGVRPGSDPGLTPV